MCILILKDGYAQTPQSFCCISTATSAAENRAVYYQSLHLTRGGFTLDLGEF